MAKRVRNKRKSRKAMENRKEKSLFGKACEEEETKATIGEEEEDDDVHVHIHAKIQKVIIYFNLGS